MPITESHENVYLATVDLTRFSMDWVVPSEDESSQEVNSYSAVARILGDELSSVFFVCDFSLSTKGRKYGDVTISASYYYRFNREFISKEEMHAVVESSTRTVVWTKFTAMAKFALSQAEMNDIAIPIVPNQIDIKSISI